MKIHYHSIHFIDIMQNPLLQLLKEKSIEKEKIRSKFELAEEEIKSLGRQVSILEGMLFSQKETETAANYEIQLEASSTRAQKRKRDIEEDSSAPPLTLESESATISRFKVEKRIYLQQHICVVLVYSQFNGPGKEFFILSNDLRTSVALAPSKALPNCLVPAVVNWRNFRDWSKYEAKQTIPSRVKNAYLVEQQLIDWLKDDSNLELGLKLQALID